MLHRINKNKLSLKKIIIQLNLIFITSLLLFSSCSNNNSSSDLENKDYSNNIVKRDSFSNIREFNAVNEEDFIRFYFLLETANGKNIVGEGNLSIIIYDYLDDILYNQSTLFKRNQFLRYENSLTGTYIGDAHEWKVSNSKIKKGKTEYGKAVIMINNNITSQTEMFRIPFYNEKEIKEIFEKEYLNNSKDINLTIEKENFNIQLKRIGFTNLFQFGETKKVFRADFAVTNKGDKSEYFIPNGIVLLDNFGNQYEMIYGGTLNTFNKIYPNVTKSGYILFGEDIRNIENSKITFELGTDENFNPIVYEFNIK